MTPVTGLDRTPRSVMPAEEVVGIIAAFQAAGLDAWLDGGWAVDAALGEQTREHDDLDLVVELRHVDAFVTVLEARGYVVGRGMPPTSIELVDGSGRQVDLHPVVLDELGNGLYRMEEGGDWTYPASGFSGSGRVRGRQVRCLTPEIQLLCHTGYEAHESSYDDVWALARRFDLRVPEAYRRPRESYPPR